MSELKDHYHYLPISERDRQWGLYVLGAGYQYVPPNSQYPPAGHQGNHSFDWKRGRILQEYQILYVTDGEGEFESKATGRVPVSAGSALVLFPGIWHRYRPAKDIGWDVYWVAFHGEAADRLRQSKFIDPREAAMNPGMDDSLLHHFTVLLDRIHGQQIGFQQLIAADVSLIVASLLANARSRRMSDYHVEIVNRLKMELEKQAGKLPRIEDLADILNISTRQLHQLFKEHTGLSPYQYHLQLKIRRAKDMLRGSNLSVKNIARTLGFQNAYYFSRIFAKKTGVPPTKWRTMGQKK
jgi:AraC-like DNA-binding protein